MDLLTENFDFYVLDKVFYSFLPKVLSVEKSFTKITISLYLLFLVGGAFFYFFFSGLNYIYFNVVFHDFYFPGRIKKLKIHEEISVAISSIPIMSAFSVPVVIPEFYGYSKLYNDVSEYSYGYMLFSLVWFVVFSDTCIYFIHRAMHSKLLYGRFHKSHHAFVDIMSPFASHAFHPFDGFMQGLPYHIFVYLFPLHKKLYIFLFVCVNLWTISIHDMVYFNQFAAINGSANHALHHAEFNYNFGQYFIFWDYVFGTYKAPKKEEMDGSYNKRKIN